MYCSNRLMRYPDPEGTEGGTPPKDSTTDDSKEKSPKELKFTQEQVNEILRDRLKRQEEQYKQKMEEAVKNASLAEEEKLKVLNKQLEEQVQSLDAQVRRTTLESEATKELLKSGIRGDRVDAALKLLDLSGDEFEVVKADLPKRAKTFAESFPEFTSAAPKASGGGDFTQSQNGNALSDEAIANMTTEELKKRRVEVEAFYRNRR